MVYIGGHQVAATGRNLAFNMKCLTSLLLYYTTFMPYKLTRRVRWHDSRQILAYSSALVPSLTPCVCGKCQALSGREIDEGRLMRIRDNLSGKRMVKQFCHALWAQKWGQIHACMSQLTELENWLSLAYKITKWWLGTFCQLSKMMVLSLKMQWDISPVHSFPLMWFQVFEWREQGHSC